MQEQQGFSPAATRQPRHDDRTLGVVPDDLERDPLAAELLGPEPGRLDRPSRRILRVDPDVLAEELRRRALPHLGEIERSHLDPGARERTRRGPANAAAATSAAPP
jgi:hypothetical protein